MITKQDASVILKDQIGESALRLKAAKFGQTVDEIAPPYETSFYLPHKESTRNSVVISKTTKSASNEKRA